MIDSVEGQRIDPTLELKIEGFSLAERAPRKHGSVVGQRHGNRIHQHHDRDVLRSPNGCRIVEKGSDNLDRALVLLPLNVLDREVDRDQRARRDRHCWNPVLRECDSRSRHSD